MDKRPEGEWCVVANIVKERPFGPGGKETRTGTRQFRGGAKVYIVETHGGDTVVCIGQQRKSRRFIACFVSLQFVESFRPAVVYHPKVREIIANSHRKQIETEYDAVKWAATFVRWKDPQNSAEDEQPQHIGEPLSLQLARQALNWLHEILKSLHFRRD